MKFRTDDIDNLFAPPEGKIGLDQSPDRGDFFALFLRWERYRLIYNLILTLESVAGLAMSPARSLPVFFSLPMLAIGANVCLCAGLILNGYAWWIGWRSVWISRIIFAAGMLLAIALAGVVLVGLSHSGPWLFD